MLRTTTIMWVLVLVGLLALYIGLYPTFSSDAETTRKLFDHLPEAIRAAFKIDVDTMLSFLGFFAFTFTNLTLAAAIHSMHTGVSIFSREQRSKTTDFLLSKPRSRSRVFVEKFLAGVTAVLLTWGCMTVAAFTFAKLFGAGEFSEERFGLLMFAMLVIQLWFYVAGIFASQVIRRLKSTISTTLAVVFGFFMVAMVGAVLNEPKVRYFSPFKFFDFTDIAAGKGFELIYVSIAAVTILAALVMSWRRYATRDVRAV